MKTGTALQLSACKKELAIYKGHFEDAIVAMDIARPKVDLLTDIIDAYNLHWSDKEVLADEIVYLLEESDVCEYVGNTLRYTKGE